MLLAHLFVQPVLFQKEANSNFTYPTAMRNITISKPRLQLSQETNLTLNCKVSTKRSHNFKQTSSF